MSVIDTFRKQHSEILEAASQLEALLNEANLSSSGQQARTTLSALAGRIQFHLNTEDKLLYPQLLAAADPSIVATTKRFQDEMGSVLNKFSGYVASWPAPKTIEADAAGFIAQTKEVLNVLKKRIQVEETSLYPLLEKVPARS